MTSSPTSDRPQASAGTTAATSILSAKGGDPYPLYEELRAKGPVHWDTRLRGWVVLSYALCREIETREDLYRHPYANADTLTIEVKGGPGNITILQGEAHARVRRLMANLLSPPAIEGYRRGHVRPVVHALIDRFVMQGKADLASSLADLVPPRVVCSLFGMPWRDDTLMRTVVRHNDSLAAWIGRPGHRTPELDQQALATSYALNDILLPTIRLRRTQPDDDLISRIWADGAATGTLTGEADVLATCRELLFAGSHTTMGWLANAIHLLLSNVEMRQAVMRDRTVALANFLEESVRLFGPLQYRFRLANQDGEVGGQPVKMDDLVFLVHAAANRDPAQFTCPARVDLARPRPKEHLAFNAGPRTCIGAALARAEAREVMEAILDRLPGIRFDPEAPPPAENTLFSRSFRPLNVCFESTASPKQTIIAGDEAA